MKDIISGILNHDFHAVHFTFLEKNYIFSGWWLLDWDDGDKEYMTVEEFLDDPIFDGKTIKDIADNVTDVWFELYS